MKSGTAIVRQLDKLAAFLNRRDVSGATKKVQEELKDDLLLIISPPDHHREYSWDDANYPHTKRKDSEQFSESKHARFSTRRDGLELLLDKLKRLNLESWYTVNDSTLERVPDDTRRRFPRANTILAFPDGQTITINKVLKAGSDREYYFGIILEAVNTGDLARLRKCDECGKFFVSRHPSKLYCGSRCQKRRDKIAARSRAKAWRINQN